MQTKHSLPEISPQELKQKLDENGSVLLLDVREPSEYDIVHLEGAVNTAQHTTESSGQPPIRPRNCRLLPPRTT